ncbi:MAG: hypothetical protein F6K40_20210 [Okeania sp. SIO3I5]|uniref:SGNH/GDSL hydrolase family protein n=1 Tax=Okeania sp. SIO3I5 TaxID=2607805 RepID=UPI0013BCF09B|nr:SGNH/GDSL hydrolase family protein [Okeania sp. SIO3I5]NEQ38464.1 hypothetical protein [Okeania sp. SIO3I5]
MNDNSLRQTPKIIKIVSINLILIVAILSLLEGLSSILLLFYRISKVQPRPRISHSQYDELLGWVNIPNVDIPNKYGEGIYFKTNSQSFRNHKDFSINIPPNKVRIICSGDSVTMGWGVSNDQSWCHLLTLINQRLQTINMAQQGYGIDQAYLRYKRDGTKFEHNIQIFAFITHDFVRMQNASFMGRGKPLLYLENGELVNHNFPVPRYSFLFPKVTQSSKYIQKLSFFVIWKKLFAQKLKSNNKYVDKTPAIAMKIFEDLAAINQDKNSKLVVVYLPSRSDYYNNDSNFWREYLQAELQKRNIIYIDLIPEFRDKIPNEQLGKAFLGGDKWHYSVSGNEFIANVLYEKLLSLPEVGGILQE